MQAVCKALYRTLQSRIGPLHPRDWPALARSFLHWIVDTCIRLIIFGVPVSFVAQWCDVQLTWKLMAFICFFVIWGRCVLERSDAPASEADASTVRRRQPAAEVLTPAQVAAEARKLTREWKPKPVQ